jgi:Anti-sigma-K factor rskA
MSAMDHAAAHERIEDLLLEPARLAALARSTASDDVALRDHLAGCPACRADLETWVRLQAALGDALPGSATEAGGAVERAELPASLRARVISAVRSEEAPIAPVAMAAERRRSWWRVQTPLAALGLAAALVVLAVGAGLLVDQIGKLSTAQEEARGLAEAIAAVDRVLVEPQHRVVALSTPDGTAAGSISWTRHDLVVLTSALQTPKPGEVYRCWLSDDGTGWAIGRMYFADGTAYWVGTLDEWASFEIGPTTMFRVSLEPPGADPAKRSGPIVLEAALGAS